MIILDIDLDAFVSPIAYGRGSSSDNRLPEGEYRSWDTQRVDAFLLEQLSLPASGKIPGKQVKHHHEVFHCMRRMFEAGRLKAPVHLIHVDAHADLGGGAADPGFRYLLTDLLNQPLQHRYSVREGDRKLNAGNFLAFLSACRWVTEITWVAPPEAPRDDPYPSCFFAGDNPESGVLQLPACDITASVEMLETAHSHYECCEPKIPFHFESMTDFRLRETPDFVFLAQSPQFTPLSADKLIPSILSRFAESPLVE